MNHSEERTEYVTRDTILKLLSDAEIARVSTAETAAHLQNGDEYVDLDAPERGVQRAPVEPPTPMGQVLPRKAVGRQTWRRIGILLAAHIAATARARST